MTQVDRLKAFRLKVGDRNSEHFSLQPEHLSSYYLR